MSVLIKGIEMPKNCLDCPCLNSEEMYCQVTGKNLGLAFASLYKASGCPLVEVPTPHGRLIDADKLMEDGWKLYKEVIRMGGYAIHEKPLNYPDIPTIIESEGE